MEMTRATYRINKWVRICLCMVLWVSFLQVSSAQVPAKKYFIRDGRMVIELSKKINNESLDSFISQYNLYDIPLRQLIVSKATDSLAKLGWTVELNNRDVLVISKLLTANFNINNPSEKIIFTQKGDDNIYPVNMGRITYGVNRFRNKYSFDVNGAAVTFFLRNNLSARKVMLAGTFNNWMPEALGMKKTDSGWIVIVRLEAGKHWYKFIIDGNWRIDTDNIINESDGRGNMNSVYYKTNFIFAVDGYQNARNMFVAGSFNNWRSNELPMNRAGQGWQLPVYLTQGTYAYKFVADKTWITDPKNTNRLPDGQNGYNSIVQIGTPRLFKLSGYSDAKQVALIGSFNEWHNNELFMRKTDEGWELPYVLGGGNYEYRFSVDGKQISDPSNPPPGDPGKGNSFLIVDPNYTFRLKGFSNAKSIFLAGDFNNWSPATMPMQRGESGWTIKINLSPGKHLYKYLVDGKWIIDPGNKLWEQNEYGTGNSVLWVEK